MWIHEQPDWPNFTWNASHLAGHLADIRYRLGRLHGRMELLGFRSEQEAALISLTNDVTKSSAIEGVVLDSDEVRSSIARQLGIDAAGLKPPSHYVEGVVAMALDATRNFAEPLTNERLFGWHRALFPEGRSGLRHIVVGKWRTLDAGPMRVVSGPVGREKVHYEAPSADRLGKEMQTFLHWFEGADDVDPVLKAGAAHLWFEMIHPFADGNGRIGRSIADLALAGADRMPARFYSLSAQFHAERKDYYRQLEKQGRDSLDITGWLDWFLSCLGRAISNADKTLDHVLFKANLWRSIGQTSVSERQRTIINRMLEQDFEGYMNTSKYSRMAKCSKDTALRDIQDLKAKGILIQNAGGGRSTSYRLLDQFSHL